MLNQKATADFEKLVKDSKEERARVRKLVHEGRWKEAEEDPNRAARFRLKNEIKRKRNGSESQVGDTLDWVDVSFLLEAARVQLAVGYIRVMANGISKTGTGFMISNSLLITNCHVISNEQEATLSTATFNRQTDETGRDCPITEYRLDPAIFFLKSEEDEFDYAIIGLGRRTSGELTPENIGYFVLSDAPDKHVIGMNVNIIQHPLELPKKVTFRNNLLAYRTDHTLLYESDTETCSSGSPVCNDDWDLIALHHWGRPYRSLVDEPNSNLPETVNEGIRISSIYKKLSTEVEGISDTSQRALLVEALSFARTQPSIQPKVPVRKPNPAGGEAGARLPELQVSGQENNSIIPKRNNMPNANNEIKVTIPIEVTIKVGDSHLGVQQVAAQVKPVPEAEQELFSEANKIDRNYSNRSGYAEDFIPGFIIPLPVVKNTSFIAPLKSNQPKAADGVLKYEHFSLILNKAKRCAFFSATNIDGKTYMHVDRDTGVVTPRKDLNESEGEVWYDDDRIDPKYHLNQPFFSAWSHLFDRGHLTRRTDPSWGTKAIALRADADTFHFANCSIQHFRFNQTLQYWQGLERYVLENGFLKADPENHLVVFQGPVYNDAVDYYADDFQIPSEFFKIAVWNSHEKGLQAVGLIARQSELFGEQRKGLKQPGNVAAVNVSEWRVPIRDIEKAAKLDFGDLVRSADTIGDEVQPPVGESMVKFPITDWSDLLKGKKAD